MVAFGVFFVGRKCDVNAPHVSHMLQTLRKWCTLTQMHAEMGGKENMEHQNEIEIA